MIRRGFNRQGTMENQTVYEKFVTAISGDVLFFLIFGLIITPAVAWLRRNPRFRFSAISINILLAFASLIVAGVVSHLLHYIPRREDLIFAAVVAVGAVVAQYFLKPQSGPIAAAPVSCSGVLETTRKALQNGEEELRRLVSATSDIVHRLYRYHEKVVKVVPFAQETWTIHANGDLYTERVYHIRTDTEKIFYWELYFGPEPEGDPVTFVTELDFQAIDETSEDTGVVYLISRNDPRRKDVVLFFLPAIDPGESEPRRIRIKYRWPGYWNRLLTKGSEISTYSLRSPIAELERTYKIHPGAGALIVEPLRKIPGEQKIHFGPDASGIEGWTYKVKDCAERELRFKLELRR